MLVGRRRIGRPWAKVRSRLRAGGVISRAAVGRRRCRAGCFAHHRVGHVQSESFTSTRAYAIGHMVSNSFFSLFTPKHERCPAAKVAVRGCSSSAPSRWADTSSDACIPILTDHLRGFYLRASHHHRAQVHGEASTWFSTASHHCLHAYGYISIVRVVVFLVAHSMSEL
jgi:hypothetical protein